MHKNCPASINLDAGQFFFSENHFPADCVPTHWPCVCRSVSQAAQFCLHKGNVPGLWCEKKKYVMISKNRATGEEFTPGRNVDEANDSLLWGFQHLRL